jgi:hypothetical protein
MADYQVSLEVQLTGLDEAKRQLESVVKSKDTAIEKYLNGIKGVMGFSGKGMFNFGSSIKSGVVALNKHLKISEHARNITSSVSDHLKKIIPQSVTQNKHLQKIHDVINKHGGGIFGSLKNGFKSIGKSGFNVLTGGGSKGAGGLGAAGVGVGVMAGVAAIAILAKILQFIMGLAPIKAIMQIIQKLLTIFFLPPAIMFMAILLPFLMMFSNILRQINLPQFIKQIMGIEKIISNVLTMLFKYLNPYLLEGIKAIMYVMIGLGVILAAPLVAIVGIITIVATGIGLLITFFKIVASFISKYLPPVVKFLTSIYDFFANGISNTGSDIMKALESVTKLQTGGTIGSNGLAYLHKGEVVIPAGQNTTNNLGVTVHANVSREVDVNQLADVIYKRIQYRLRGNSSW